VIANERQDWSGTDYGFILSPISHPPSRPFHIHPDYSGGSAADRALSERVREAWSRWGGIALAVGRLHGRPEALRTICVAVLGAVPCRQARRRAEVLRGVSSMSAVTPSAAFKQATAFLQAGMLERAASLCKVIIRQRPRDFDLLHLLAIIQAQLGHAEDALANYNRALAVKPDSAEALYNRGIILRNLNRLDESLTSYDRALEIKPDFAAALVNRGLICHQLNRLGDALTSYETALAIKPEYAEALYNRGITLFEMKQFEEALKSYDQALLISPDYPQGHYNRGIVLQHLKRLDEALASYDCALAVKPDYAEAQINRANVLYESERYEEALASYEAILAKSPRYAEMLYGRGNALRALNRYEAAIASYDAALAIKPDYAEALNNCGVTLWDLRHLEDALASYNRALAIKPNYLEALVNRGITLWGSKRFEEALTSYDMAVAIAPEHAQALYNRGIVLLDLKRPDQAITDFERVLKLSPEFKHLKGLLVHTKMQCCDWRSFADQARQLIDDVRAHRCVSGPFELLSVSADAADQLTSARDWVFDKCPPAPHGIWQGERYANEKIRIAYLSADFHDHPMSYLMSGVFERHNRARFETIAFSFGPDWRCESRTRLKGAFSRFIDVRHESDQQVAALLRGMRVDIAIDLMGFTRDARTGIFARRPAPIQVNYLGYPATMGAAYIDYIIADRFAIPCGSRRFYSESVVYLPDSFQATDASPHILQEIPTRADVGLPENAFVFCSFNASYKITPFVFDVWMRLLRSLDNSVLWLLGANAAVEHNLRCEAERRGVAPGRIIFAPRIAYAQYLARYQLAELFLDTFPFNAGATASDALSVGLPLITISGEAFAARMAGSLLHSMGLSELVTHSLADYEALALRLARHPEALTVIRTKLARHRADCPLFDADRFCRHLEIAYETMWQRCDRGEPPASFAVEPAPQRRAMPHACV
jgi:protein O-GlcNAc transferase